MKRKVILATAIVVVGLALPSGSSAAPFAYVTSARLAAQRLPVRHRRERTSGPAVPPTGARRR